MIIELKDLPQTQKIKYIDVHIEFDKEGNCSGQSVSMSEHDDTLTGVQQHQNNEDDFFDSTVSSSHDAAPQKPVITTDRESKEIPSEMMDLEL